MAISVSQGEAKSLFLKIVISQKPAQFLNVNEICPWRDSNFFNICQKVSASFCAYLLNRSSELDDIVVD